MDSMPNSNENHGPAFEWMVRNLHETTHRYRYLEAVLQPKDAELNRLQENEDYFRQQLSFSRPKDKEQEQNIVKLRGEVQSLKHVTPNHSQSVPKSQNGEVLEQNKKIAENNVKLNQQNEELVTTWSSRNIVRQNWEVRMEQEKGKSLEKKLSFVEKFHKTKLEQVQHDLSKTNDQILVLNNKLKASSENVDSYLIENQNLLKKIESYEAERKQHAIEQEQINAKNNVEIRGSCKLNFRKRIFF
ncbi:unnamed protein product [Orchesella dallaii]|uniref:Uncharacterized protein n=1 Tax=Orchesella dallaii TaxID=48710 RepID=A0ABP1RI15_9HEXA